MQRREIDVSAVVGSKMVIELIDNARGGWAHLLFDDVRLRSKR